MWRRPHRRMTRPRRTTVVCCRGGLLPVAALRDEVMTMRLLPFSSIVPRLERAVRDLAGRLGKDVDLDVRGTEVSLDRSTLEEMIDPLQYILRNSIDQGLEAVEERRTV